MNANGSWSYTPDLGYAGGDAFTYTVDDGVMTDTGTVTLSVTNPPAVVTDDSWSLFRNRSLTVPARGVLGNDSDANGDALQVTVVTPPPSAR